MVCMGLASQCTAVAHVYDGCMVRVYGYASGCVFLAAFQTILASISH